MDGCVPERSQPGTTGFRRTSVAPRNMLQNVVPRSDFKLQALSVNTPWRFNNTANMRLESTPTIDLAELGVETSKIGRFNLQSFKLQCQITVRDRRNPER